MAHATFTHSDGRKLRTQSSRRYVVVRDYGERLAVEYRTDVLERAYDKRSRVGGFVFDTVAKAVV